MRAFSLIAFTAISWFHAVPTACAQTSSTPTREISPQLAKLAEARVKAEQDGLARVLKVQVDDSHFDPEKEYVWSKRLLEAEREAAPDNVAVATALKSHVDRMVELETKTKKREKDRALRDVYQNDALIRLAAVTFYR